MKNMNKILMVLMAVVLLVSCKPADKYVGDWYAVSGSGDELKINFSKEKTMTVTGGEHEEHYEINQTSTGIQNSTRYFGIEVKGASHYVIFDNTKDEDNAKFVKQTNQASDFEDVVGDVIFLMNRNDYPVN